MLSKEGEQRSTSPTQWPAAWPCNRVPQHTTLRQSDVPSFHLQGCRTVRPLQSTAPCRSCRLRQHRRPSRSGLCTWNSRTRSTDHCTSTAGAAALWPCERQSTPHRRSGTWCKQLYRGNKKNQTPKKNTSQKMEKQWKSTTCEGRARRGPRR